MDCEADSERERFGHLREAFHHLLDLQDGEREASLRALAREDAALVAELRGLLGCLDAADLEPGGDDRPPAQLGQFRVVQRIGRGGMGDVFLGERIEGGFEQRVALKRLRASAFVPSLQRRFLRERQILARLQHPNIARLLDGGRGADGRPWLAMELVQGERITDWCARAGLDVHARVRCFLSVCDAVQFAHRNLVVHRDIKPSNILVDAQGTPKLLDFGIAGLLDTDAAEQTQTLVALTPAYAAPEQREGGRTTTATDVYQLGVVLQELVEAAPMLGHAQRRRRGAFSSGDLARIVQKARQPRPEERYASVAMLADDLRDWLETRPLRSRIGGARGQVACLLRRYRWPISVGVGVMLSLAIGALVSLDQALRARAQAEIARSRLDALFGVLAAANPGRYTAREPDAGDFLLEALRSLRQRVTDDPALHRRANIEVAHALINLGRPSDAEPLLEEALTRELDPREASQTLGLLGLLMHAQDVPGGADRAVLTAGRIEALVRQDDIAPARAVDALARAAGVVSAFGRFEIAERLFGLADARLGPDLPLATLENYWRQRGRMHLRRADVESALQDLTRAAGIHVARPDEFSALRRAEGERMLAEARLAKRDVALAEVHLAAARPVLLAEYAEGHPERASLQVFEAEMQLAAAAPRQALELLAIADGPLQAGGATYARDRYRVLALRARALAALGRCDAAAIALADLRKAGLEILLPREAVAQRQAQKDVRLCAASGP